MFCLRGYRRDMSLVDSLFLRSRTLVYTAVAAIEANTGYGSVVYSCLVNIVNLRDVDVGHRTIVKKVVVVPTSTFEAMTKVTVAIVDSAIKTYNRTPIALIKNETATVPSPIARSPEETDFRS
jgi:ADP-glucose pyrophosphorylase